ncbi:MAG: hypothetical protein DWQ11_03080 [Proteobacteria bacterium]|nr:MAG: hypothetical protein DWQ11_03080 [Pseudomonadota bacterium]
MAGGADRQRKGGLRAPGRRRRLARLVLLLSAAAFIVTAVLAWQFSDRWLADAVADEINARIGGGVHIDGPVSLQVFPPRLALAGITWQGDGAVRIDHLVVRSDWSAQGAAHPLHIELHGIRGSLHQAGDGHWRLPVPAMDDPPAAPAVPVQLATVLVSDAVMTLTPHDAPPATVRLARAELTDAGSGWRLQAAGSAAGADATLEGTLSATVDAGARVRDLTVALAGVVGPVQIDALTLSAAAIGQTADAAWQAEGIGATLRARQDERQLTLSAEGDTLRHDGTETRLLGLRGTATLSPAAADAPATARFDALTLHLAGPQLAVTGNAQLATTLPVGPVALHATGAALALDLSAGLLDARLPALDATVPDPARPGATVALHAAVSGQWQVAARTGAGTIQFQVEDSRLDGQWQVALDAAHRLALQARVDRLDLDRWQAAGPKTRDPLPLDAWRDWPLQLDLQVGHLRLQGIDARDTRLRLNTP